MAACPSGYRSTSFWSPIADRKGPPITFAKRDATLSWHSAIERC